MPDEYLLAEEQHLKIRRLATRIGRSFGEVPLDGVSGTLLASYASNLSWGPYVRVEDAAGRRRSYSDGKPLLRRLTPRECARLQGFPDDFTILGPDAEAYRQLGNAVTVTVAEAVATNLKVVLDA